MLHGRGLKTDLLIAGRRHAGVSAYTDMWKFRTGAIDEEPCGPECGIARSTASCRGRFEFQLGLWNHFWGLRV